MPSCAGVRVHFDLSKFRVHDALDADRLSVQMPKFAGGLHPRFIAGFSCRAFSLHFTMFPYLREHARMPQARHTISPFTMVATGPPRKEAPSNGVLRLLEKDLFTS